MATIPGQKGGTRQQLTPLLHSRPPTEAAKKKQNVIWDRFNNGWNGEVVALLFSLACSIAIVVVLLLYDHKPTPKLPKGITLNAIVSVLATASKAALLFTISSCLGQLKWTWFKRNKAKSLAHVQIFDGASRGPLGALELFGSESRKSAASLGAMLTLLALAYDPFVQQVIQISPELQYSASNNVATRQATRFVVPSIEQLSQQALYAGIYTDRFERSPACSTGNCTFPRFSSVGWCSQCSQPTDWEFADGCSLIFDDTDFGVKDGALIPVNRTCRLTSSSGLPQDFALQAFGGIGLGYNYLIEMPTFQITTEFVPDPTVQNPHFPWGGRVPIGEWAFIYFKITDWSLAVDSVNVCTLDLCLRDYEITVDGGTTHAIESNPRFGRRYIRSENFSELTGPDDTNDFPYECWELKDAPKNSSWEIENIPYSSLGTLQFYASPSEFAFCIPRSSWNTNWNIQIGKAINAINGLTTTPAYFGSNSSVEDGILRFGNTSMVRSITGTSYNGSATFSDPELYGVNSYTIVGPALSTIHFLGFQTTMSNIAASLTDLAIKDQYANEITGYLGTVETVLRVRWEWLALPAFLVLGGALFLLFTIIISSRSMTPIWKSSVNALLYHGLEDDVAECSDSLLTVSSMDDMAASASVSLITSRRSARLVLATPSSPTSHISPTATS